MVMTDNEALNKIEEHLKKIRKILVRNTSLNNLKDVDTSDYNDEKIKRPTEQE